MRYTTQGQILFSVLIFSVSATLVLTGFVGWAGVNLKALRGSADRELAFHIAEAGIDYYRWHLAHAPTDYQDGTGQPGPYVHEFENAEGERIGTFTLDITPPDSGSTVVAIRSTGEVDTSPGVTRTIAVRFAIPSFAKYAWVLDSFVNFGTAAEVFGPIHSNDGIRFDGLAHNLVTSAKYRFDDPDHSGGQEYGVHTHESPIDPLPPAPPLPPGTPPSRPDIFEAGRQVSVPEVDFDGIISDLSVIQEDTEPGYDFPVSGGLGYHVVLKTNDTFDLYRVNSLYSKTGCSCSGIGCGTWSIKSGGETSLGTRSFPNNGLLFFADNVWVDGKIDGARLTIAAATLPAAATTHKHIIVNKDLLYTHYDGTDVIGLIAQGNFHVGLVSENDLRIDAAVIAQNGRVGRYSYSSGCSPNHLRSQLTTYGMLGSNERSGFWYGSNGYEAREYVYDGNLLYSPPPSFPLTSDQYATISWEEVE